MVAPWAGGLICPMAPRDLGSIPGEGKIVIVFVELGGGVDDVLV